MFYGPRCFYDDGVLQRLPERTYPQPVPRLLTHVEPPAPEPEPRRYQQAIATLTEIDPARLEPSLDAILRAVSAATGVAMADLVSPRRQRRYVRTRFVYFHVARTLTSKSFPQIGYYCGHRHHTTVMNGLRRARQFWSEIAADVAAVENRLKAKCKEEHKHG